MYTSFTTVQRRRTHARGMTSPYIIRQLGQGQGLLVKTSFTVRQRIYDCLFTFFSEIETVIVLHGFLPFSAGIDTVGWAPGIFPIGRPV